MAVRVVKAVFKTLTTLFSFFINYKALCKILDCHLS
jgi:hypothetical protein